MALSVTWIVDITVRILCNPAFLTVFAIYYAVELHDLIINQNLTNEWGWAFMLEREQGLGTNFICYQFISEYFHAMMTFPSLYISVNIVLYKINA